MLKPTSFSSILPLALGLCAFLGGAAIAAEVGDEAASKEVTFRSTGRVSALLFNLRRDRSITLTPMFQESHLVAVKARIVDHADGDKVVEGQLKMNAKGVFEAEDPRIVNAASILNLTPAILDRLKKTDKPVMSHGSTEVSGNVIATRMIHRRLSKPGKGRSMRVRSETTSPDGRFDTVTITEVGVDGLPMRAKTTGTIQKGLLSLDVDLDLSRMENRIGE